MGWEAHRRPVPTFVRGPVAQAVQQKDQPVCDPVCHHQRPQVALQQPPAAHQHGAPALAASGRRWLLRRLLSGCDRRAGHPRLC